jgi:threonine dehydrogenase-like Zn-dependent dehydrogenase
MKAVVARRGRLFIDDHRTDPVPGVGQVLVRTLACGICGSDLHALHHMHTMIELNARAGGKTTVDPEGEIVLGHEFCAEVLEHGPGTESRLKPGTRVVSVPYAAGPQGMELVGFSHRFPGGFGERMVLTEAMLLEVPNGLSSALAAMTEPFAVGAHAVSLARMDEHRVPLVMGCGPVGLAVIAALKSRGYGPIIACDFSPERRRIAEELGADVVLNPAQSSPFECWTSFDVPATLAEQSVAAQLGRKSKRPTIFECTGAPGVLSQMFKMAPPLTRIVVVGTCQTPESLEPGLAITKQLSLEFALAYSSDEFASVLADIAQGRINAAAALTSTVGLNEIPQAFESLRSPGAHAKIIVEPA